MKIKGLLLAGLIAMTAWSTTAYANSNVPGPLETGSIQIHTRMGSSDNDPNNSGVPIRNVPLRIERVQLVNPNVAPTESELRDPAWIEANTRSLNTPDVRTNMTHGGGFATFTNLPQGIWLVSQTDGTVIAPNPIPVDQRFNDFLVGIPTFMEDGEVRLDVVVYPKVDREELQDVTMEIVAHYDNFFTIRFGMQIPTTIRGADTSREFLDAFMIVDERFVPQSAPGVNGRLPLAPGQSAPFDGDYLQMRNGQHLIFSQQVINGTNVLRLGVTTNGWDMMSNWGAEFEGRLEFDVNFAFAPGTLNADNLGEIVVSDAIVRYGINDRFDWSNPGDIDLSNGWPEDIQGIRTETRFTTFGINMANLTVGARQLIANNTFSLHRDITHESETCSWSSGRGAIAEVDVNGTIRCLETLRMQAGDTGEEGIFTWYGVNSISATNEGETFWINQLTAQDGHRIINEWIEFEVSEQMTGLRDEDNFIVLDENTYMVPLNVYNELDIGWILPSTGATGTIIFTVLGTTLMGAAIFIHARND